MDKYDGEYWMDPENHRQLFRINPATGDVENCIDFVVKHNIQINRDNHMWQVNIRKNVKDAAPENMLGQFAGQLPGKTMLCVGAGPSIHSEYENIKEFQRRGATIIACDRVNDNLISNGIVAEYVMTVDASPKTARFFKYARKEQKVIAAVTIDRKTVRTIKSAGAKIYWFVPPNPFNTLTYEAIKLYPPGIISIRAEVTCGYSAVSFAVFSRSDEIILIGMDFCWKSWDEIEPIYRERKNIELVEVEDESGQKLWFIQPFYHGMNTLMDFLNMFKDEIKFTDCSFGMLRNIPKKKMINLLEEHHEKVQ